MKKLYFTFYVVVTVSSCTHKMPYPPNWPEIIDETKQDCKNFNGIYENFNGEKYLSNLFGLEEVILHTDQKIQLTILENNNLKVKVLDTYNEKTSFKITPNYMDYTCNDGTIHIKGKPDYLFHPYVISVSSPLIKINTAEDQSVIAYLTHKMNTLVFFTLPVFNNNTEWRKWERITE